MTNASPPVAAHHAAAEDATMVPLPQPVGARLSTLVLDAARAVDRYHAEQRLLRAAQPPAT